MAKKKWLHYPQQIEATKEEDAYYLLVLMQIIEFYIHIPGMQSWQSMTHPKTQTRVLFRFCVEYQNPGGYII